MSQQHPQQPGWAGQPQQPQWGAPTQPGWGTPPPQPPKKRSAGKIVGLGCLGIVGLFVVIAIIAAVANGGSSKKNDSSGTNNAASASHGMSKSGDSKAKTGGSAAKTDKAPSTVTFKVWGTASAGALGGLDISYGSDSDTREGTFKNGKFTATLPFKKNAMYYQVMAQLQGSGDIHCSVTVDGHTKTAHASGGYNICDTQLSSFTGDDWS